jgi:hypothetical protein
VITVSAAGVAFILADPFWQWTGGMNRSESLAFALIVVLLAVSDTSAVFDRVG